MVLISLILITKRVQAHPNFFDYHILLIGYHCFQQ